MQNLFYHSTTSGRHRLPCLSVPASHNSDCTLPQQDTGESPLIGLSPVWNDTPRSPYHQAQRHWPRTVDSSIVGRRHHHHHHDHHNHHHRHHDRRGIRRNPRGDEIR